MAKKRQSTYWYLLLAILFVAVSVMSVGQTQARYVNAKVWNTVAVPAEETVTSDCLNTPDVPLTVLLGEMTLDSNAPMDISFWLQSNQGVSGKLTWTVDHADYMNVDMSIGASQIQQGETVGLSPEDRVPVLMTITPSEKALTDPRDALPVHIQVNWADMLEGTFEVILPAVVAEETPEDPEGEDTTGDSEAPATGEEAGTEETQSSDPAAQTADSTDATTDPDTQTGNTGAVIALETISAFCPDRTLPVKVITQAQVQQVQLGVADMTQEQTQMVSFPRFTRFSLDGGKSYTMLYYADMIQWDCTDQQEQLVLMDFSCVTQSEIATLNIMANALTGEALLESCSVTTAGAIAQICQMSTRILETDTTLQIQTTPLWKDYEFTFEVQKLVAQTAENGQTILQFETLNPENTNLVWEQDTQETGTVLTFHKGNELPEAGTYRVDMRWSYNGMTFGQTQETFFINYSIQPEPAQTETEQAETEQAATEQTETEQTETEQTGGAGQ